MYDSSNRHAAAKPALLCLVGVTLLVLAGCGRSPDSRDAALKERLDSLSLQVERLQESNAEQRTSLMTLQKTLVSMREEQGLPAAPARKSPPAAATKPTAAPAPPAAAVPPAESPARSSAASTFLRTFGILCFTAFLIVQFTKIWRKRRQGPEAPGQPSPGTGGGAPGSTVYSPPPKEEPLEPAPENPSAPQAAEAAPGPASPPDSSSAPEATLEAGPEASPPATPQPEPRASSAVGVYDAPAEGREEPKALSSEKTQEADASRWTIYRPGSGPGATPVGPTIPLSAAAVPPETAPEPLNLPEDLPAEEAATEVNDAAEGTAAPAGPEIAELNPAQETPAQPSDDAPQSASDTPGAPGPAPASPSQQSKPGPGGSQAPRKGKHGKRHR